MSTAPVFYLLDLSTGIARVVDWLTCQMGQVEDAILCIALLST